MSKTTGKTTEPTVTDLTNKAVTTALRPVQGYADAAKNMKVCPSCGTKQLEQTIKIN